MNPLRNSILLSAGKTSACRSTFSNSSSSGANATSDFTDDRPAGTSLPVRSRGEGCALELLTGDEVFALVAGLSLTCDDATAVRAATAGVADGCGVGEGVGVWRSVIDGQAL